MPAPVNHHIALSVHDIDRSAERYARLFDLTVAPEFGKPDDTR